MEVLWRVDGQGRSRDQEAGCLTPTVCRWRCGSVGAGGKCHHSDKLKNVGDQNMEISLVWIMKHLIMPGLCGQCP